MAMRTYADLVLQGARRDDFNSWYRDPLMDLCKARGTGFIITIVSLALLERYLREVTGTHEKVNVDDNFYDGLMRIFPELKDRDHAQTFWGCTRHGLLHQASFRLRPGHEQGAASAALVELPEVAISITGDKGAREVIIDPVVFTRRVLSTIEADFAGFIAAGSPNHPLAYVIGQSTGATASTTTLVAQCMQYSDFLNQTE